MFSTERALTDESAYIRQEKQASGSDGIGPEPEC